MVALYWLSERGGWSVFVSNRIKEIKTLFPNSGYRHVPGKMNPADLISRGCLPSYLVESRWWEGPLWLLESPDTWPVTELMSCETTETSSERKRIRLCNLNISKEDEQWYARRFSKFHSILRLVAWVLRFINNARNGINGRKTGQLTVDEIESAEMQLIRSVQAQSFLDEQSLSKFCVFRDEKDIIRVKTRITERIDTPNFIAPILLPSNCIFTQRLIEHFHIMNHHAGTQLLLSIILEKYWILGGRRTVRKIWNACAKCRRFKSKSRLADPVSLPADRVEDAAVFEVVGVDLAGPLYIKRGDKVWAVLYTCAIYRALHLELVSSLSTDAFLLSFRRFVARRGRPRIIYSDNGTNFKGAYNELAAIDWNEVSRYAEIQRITWKFIPPSAAWWGGFWERLVRTVKELLRRRLGRAIFTYEELLTILCECEKVVNSRPLTYLSEDMLDLAAITPAMFLFERSTAEVKDLDMRDANHFRKRLRFRAKMMEELRKRFRIEYLGQLIQRQKQNPQSLNISEGDIVLIGDDVKKRLLWPLARVIELIPGKDGLVRTVKLKTKSCTLIRPIQRVFPLELSVNDLSNLPRNKAPLTEPSENSPSSNTLETSLQSPIPETFMNSSKASQPQVTRCGRVIKRPKKLNLVTLTDVFE
ncbi:unnamed protein product [Larinioides sclopetarius]|uniref:Integrase catalytic domain-containing protein n=1 Tax=Larinioides sclopetarius TaxID=280406 RepID=A0AAV2ASA6_9ARAC